MACTGRVEIPGSQRQFDPSPRRVGEPPVEETVEVTVYLRPSGSLEWVDQETGRPPTDRPGLSREEFAANYGASEEDIASVRDFANRYDLDVNDANATRRSVTLRGPLVAVTEAFDSQNLGLFEDPSGVVYRGRHGPLTVPAELAGLITGVFGIDDRPQAARHLRRSRELAPLSYTPREVALAYNFPRSADGTGQTVGIIALGGGFRQLDIDTYFARLGVSTPSVTAIRVGGSNDQTSDGEAAFDIEVIGSIAPGARFVVYLSTASDRGFIDAVSTAVHDADHCPSVLSVGWGGTEDSWTRQALAQMEQILTEAAALGVTVIVASGDKGSTDGVRDGRQHVNFPASAPHALGCGGTSLRIDGGEIVSETVWDSDTTGGGVSAQFALPSYQSDSAVPAHPDTGQPGRGVPDIAANSDPSTGYRLLVGGEEQVIGGTGMAAAACAGLTALVNQSLGTSVGFLQPRLYAASARRAFRDITQGSNGAYRAAPGWNGCTGLGVPDGRLLQGAILGARDVGGDANRAEAATTERPSPIVPPSRSSDDRLGTADDDGEGARERVGGGWDDEGDRNDLAGGYEGEGEGLASGSDHEDEGEGLASGSDHEDEGEGLASGWDHEDEGDGLAGGWEDEGGGEGEGEEGEGEGEGEGEEGEGEGEEGEAPVGRWDDRSVGHVGKSPGSLDKLWDGPPPVPRYYPPDSLVPPEPDVPRVLNVAISDAQRRLLPRDQALARAQDYLVRVDVGPRALESVVVNPLPIPTGQLEPSSPQGWWLYVVVSSSDVDVDTAIHRLFLPVAGRSWVCECDGPGHVCTADHRDPFLYVPVRTRSGSGGAAVRCTVYDRNNAVQSVRLEFAVADKPVAGAAIRGVVDYNLVDDLALVDSLRSRRLNILTNESSAGTHKFVVNDGGRAIVVDVTEAQAAVVLDQLRYKLMEITVGTDGGTSHYDGQNRKPTDLFIADLKELALLGSMLYGAVVPDRADRAYLRDLLADRATIQVSRITKAVFPWALVYDIPRELAAAWTLCPLLQQWASNRDDLAAYPTSCPYRAHHRSNVLCPYGFWGFRHLIEQPPSVRRGVLRTRIRATHPSRAALARSLGLNQALTAAHFRDLEGCLADRFELEACDSREALRQAFADPGLPLVYFYCHGRTALLAGTQLEVPFLEIGTDERIGPTDFAAWDEDGAWGPLHWSEIAPLVFINGCGTAQLSPRDVISFVDALAGVNAAGVVGTEIPVVQAVAGEVALGFYRQFAGPGNVSVGDALYRTRIDLLRKGNVAGLVYTPFCSMDLALEPMANGVAERSSDT